MITATPETTTEEPQFASPADAQAWDRDLFVFGHAMLDQDGKHVPLDTVLIKGTQIISRVKRTD